MTEKFFELSNKKKFLLLFTHVLGGGTERHIQELKSSILKENYGVIVFRQYPDRSLLEVWVIENEHHDFEFVIETTEKYLITFLSLFNIILVHVHHLIGHNLSTVELATAMDVPLIITLHDYYFICPRVNLTLKSTNEYCGEQGVDWCNNCLKNSANSIYGFANINILREYWFNFLSKADLVIAPSNDTKNRFQKYYPNLKIKVSYHPEVFSYLSKNNISATSNIHKDTVKIGLLGYLSEVKGRNVFYKCIEDIENRKLSAKYTLFGQTEREQILVKKSYEILGNYEDENIYNFIASKEIDVFLFLSQVPETYSYVLTIPMLLKLPIVATNLGAFNERLAEYPLGKIIDWKMSTTDINDTIIQHVEYCRTIDRNFPIPVTTYFPKLEEYYGIKLVSNKAVEYNWAEIELLLQKIEKDNKYFLSHPTTSSGMRIYSKSLRKEKKYLLGLYWRIRYLLKKYLL